MVIFMQKRIPEDIVENVRKASDIIDVIGEYVQLKKQGRNYIGLCPFHEEKTPSFSVRPEKQMFYCFGCKKGGNVLNFLMELENYSFYESVKLLADRSGIEVPETDSNDRSSMSVDNQNVLSAYEWLAKLYHHLLKYTNDGKEGLDYFNERSITEDSVDAFQLGFAPNVSGLTAEFLEKKGFHQQLLVKSGLLNIQNDTSVVDPFRGRIIFPIRNHLGKTVAFGGRSINNQEPKYLNSSESELFQKGRILFNFDLAKRHIRKESEAILFEGQMDVISAYQAEVKNVVATLGTALTETQAKLLKRYVETVVICYDGDTAGIEASYKASQLLRFAGCQVKVAHLKDGMDPDLYIKKFGSEAFKDEVIKTSDTYMNFYMRYIRKNYNLSVESDRIDYIQTLIKEISMIESSIEREHYLKELSDEFDLSIDSLMQEVSAERNKIEKTHSKKISNSYTNNKPVLSKANKLMPAYHNAERKLIAYMIQDQYIAEKVQNELEVSFNVDEHKIIATHLYAFYEEGQPANVSFFIDRLRDDSIRQLVIELSMISSVAAEISDEEINDYIEIIRSQTDEKTRIKVFKEQQQLALQQNDPIKAAHIAMDILEIERQLKSSN